MALLGVSFIFPPSLIDSTWATERESRESESNLDFESGQWLRRTEPTWINNPPDPTAALRESEMLEWGRNGKPIPLDKPTRTEAKSADVSAPVKTAQKVPANIDGHPQAEPQIPGSQLVLGPATGDPAQTYRGVRVLAPNLADERNSKSDAKSAESPTVRVTGYSAAADDEAPPSRSVDANGSVAQKAKLLRQRAQRNVRKSLTRFTPASESSNPEIVLVAEPAPPQQSFFEPTTSFYSIIEQSDYQIPAGPPSATQYFALGSQPAPTTEKPTFTLPDPEDPASQPQLPDYSEVMEDIERVPPQTQPTPQLDPFQSEGPGAAKDPIQAIDPFEPQDASQPAPGQPNGDQFDDLFAEPADSKFDDELDKELKQLEERAEDDRDADIQQDLRDLGLDDDDIGELDLDDDLPTRRFDEDDTTASDCPRIYDDRDCCAEDAQCEEAFTRLRNYTLATLSLNATPEFDPSEEDPNELKRLQMAKLVESPSRAWMDRNGNTVAKGTLEDFRQGKVHVRSVEGGIVQIPYRELSRDDLCFVNAWWGLPAECPLGNEPLEIRNWTMTTFTWKAASTCHKPLYFQQLQLERYGHSAGPILQPVLSGAHFFANVIFLPYNCGLHPPNECIYDLGNYRPGDCAPWLIPAAPLHPRAALYQTAFGLGLWGVF